jgi:hypothetical protein
MHFFGKLCTVSEKKKNLKKCFQNIKQTKPKRQKKKKKMHLLSSVDLPCSAATSSFSLGVVVWLPLCIFFFLNRILTATPSPLLICLVVATPPLLICLALLAPTSFSAVYFLIF